MSARKPKSKAIPRFSSEDEERRFWATHDAVDYFDWERAAQGISEPEALDHVHLDTAVGLDAGRAPGPGQ